MNHATYTPTPPRKEEYIPGTSIIRHWIGEGEPPLIKGVKDLTKPIGTKASIVPRGYIFYEELSEVAEKLRAHGVQVTQTEKQVTYMGYKFIVRQICS